MPRKKRPVLSVKTKDYLLALIQRLEHEAKNAIDSSRKSRRFAEDKTKIDNQIAHWQSLLSAYRVIAYRIGCKCDFLEHLVVWENMENE